MLTCTKCNKELSDGAKFCDGCGARIFETVFCPNCGKQTSTEFFSAKVAELLLLKLPPRNNL